MVVSRRGFLAGLAAAQAALPFGALPGGANLAAAASPGRLAPLPPWPYGADSSASDTVLMFRGNPAHTFGGTGPIPETAPSIVWRHRTGSINSAVRGVPTTWAGTGWTGTAVKLGDYVFVGSVDSYAYAFEATTGRVVWRLPSGGFYKSSFAAFENRLYIGNTDNQLRCIDAETGRVLWRHDTGNDLDSSPCVVSGKLYIAGENGYVRCLDPRTGKLIWKTFVGGIGGGSVPGSNGSETSPAIVDGRLYGANYFGELYCLDIETGAKMWTASTGDDTDASITVSGDYIYAAAEEKASFVYCFERLTGREVWRYDGCKKGYWATPAVADGRVHVGGEDGNLHTLDAKTGALLWAFPTGDGIWSSASVVDGRVIFGSRDFHLYCLDAANGREVWRVKVDGRIISSPCIVGGKIWVGTATGYFYCLSA